MLVSMLPVGILSKIRKHEFTPYLGSAFDVQAAAQATDGEHGTRIGGDGDLCNASDDGEAM